MHIAPFTAAALVLAATASAAPTMPEKRQAVDGNFALTIGEEGLFNLDYLQTYKLSYANDSAYIGQIKYQTYSEPLVVSGAMVSPDTNGGISFLSQHQAPTGWQYAYVTPGQTSPLQFTVAHAGGTPPQGGVTTGFSFSGGGPLLFRGKNKFYACQSPDLAAINSYQIWWKGGSQLPVGVECKGPIGIMQADPCQRGN